MALEWVQGASSSTGFPWNAIGYGMTPVPLVMQSAHVIGIMGITALSVFIFAAPALLGTKQGAKSAFRFALLLFAAHLGYGAYVLYGATPAPQRTATDKSPVVRLVQPMIDQTAEDGYRRRPRGDLREAHSDYPPRRRGRAAGKPRHHRLA